MRPGAGTYGSCTYGAVGGTYGDLCPPFSGVGRPGRKLDDEELVALTVSLLVT